MGVLDFAGGTVVHINAGIAALVACNVIGKRQGLPRHTYGPSQPDNHRYRRVMLWVGWFGFNAGSAVAADGAAGMAMLVHTGSHRICNTGLDRCRMDQTRQTQYPPVQSQVLLPVSSPSPLLRAA